MNNTIALMTGASRGVGRGAARALGAKGMTVYLTGRGKEALEAAAAEVDAAGGRGIAVVCDHADDAQVKALFDQIDKEQGRLDILVNNACAVYPEVLGMPGKYWEKDLKLVDMIQIGLRSDYVAAWYGTPLLLRTPGSLMVNISFYGAVTYFMGPAYGAAKAGTDKMVHDMAMDLVGTDVSVVSLWPGYVRTDQTKAIPDDSFPPELRAILPEFETPEFTGMVIAAIHADPERKALSGKALIAAQMARKYGIKDIDGKQPRDWCDVMGAPAVYFQA